MPPRRFVWIALGIFLLLSFAVYWPQVPGSAHSIVGCPCGDIMQEVWFLKWTPWALWHGHNPLFTNWMDVPTGANLATNTSMPALAILAAPWTFLFGPVSSYNLLIWASFPVSALSCWYVVRRLCQSNLAALAAGLLYGFSPYMIGQGNGHVFLTFVPLPPLIFYAIFRICVVQEGSPRRWGVWLAAFVVVQFFISEEVDVNTVIVSLAGVVILAVVRRREIDAARVRYAVRAGAYALAVTAAVVAYPVLFQLWGPEAVHAAGHGTTHSAFKIDLLGTVVPDRFLWLSPSFLSRLGNEFTGTDIAENGGYLGVPLVGALALIVWKLRRRREVLFVAALLVVSEVLSMGRWLMVANHTIHLPLPWTIFGELPFLSSILASRFSLQSSFLVAVLVGWGVSQWVSWASAPSRGRRDRRGGVNLALGALTLASLAFYLPAVPLPTVAIPAVPAFFTTSQDLAIPAGSVVLPFPMTTAPDATAMYWQIRTSFRWRMVGGEAIIRTPRGHTTGQPAATRPTAATQYLESLSGGNVRRPAMSARLITRMHEFILFNRVSTVVLDPTALNAGLALTLFTEVMGPPLSEGGVDVWFHAQALSRRYTTPASGST